MDATLLSPIPISPSAKHTVSAQSAAEAVEKKIIGELAKCLTNAERLDFWAILNEHASINLTNVDYHLSRAAGG